MADSPKQAKVTVEGQIVLRMKNGREYELGEVSWEVPVRLIVLADPNGGGKE